MLIISTTEALAAARSSGRHPHALLDLVAARMREVTAAYADAGAIWDPEEHGAFALMEAGDGSNENEAVGLNAEAGLLGACWEICQAHPGPARVFEVVHLISNDGGWTIFVPMDADWLAPALRAKLLDEAAQSSSAPSHP